MGRHHETARELAVKMPGRWRARQGPCALDLAGGVSTTLLMAQPNEVSSPASNAHIFSYVSKGEERHRQWFDGRQVYDGPLPNNCCNIVKAGLEPRALIAEPIEVLHIYLPHLDLVQRAHEAGLNCTEGALEVIDPRFASDPILCTASATLRSVLLQPESRPSRLMLDAIVQMVTLRILQCWSNIGTGEGPIPSRVRGGLTPWQLKRVTRFLADCLDRDVGLAELAELVDLSPTHLCTAFRQSTGLPPHQWQMRRRIQRAKELLLDSKLTVTDVSLAVGYANPGHFATVFKRAAGITPRDWRRERLS